MDKRGRPTLINPQIIKSISDDIARPMPFKYACEANGIREGTGHDWMRRGEAGEEPYDVFFEAVTRARANAVRKLVDHSLNGGRGSQNAIWHLERRYRADYGDIKRIEHAGHDGGPVQITAKAVTEMSDEELLRLANPTGSDSGTGAARVIEASGAVLDGIVLPADGHGLQVGQAHALGGGAPGGTGAERDTETRDLHAAASQQELSREREIPGVVPGTESAE